MWVMKPQNSRAYVETKGTLYFHISSYSRNGESGLFHTALSCSCCYAIVWFIIIYLFFGVMKLATQNHHATVIIVVQSCSLPHRFTHGAVVMQNTMHSCYHAECHTASNMQLLLCRMPHSFTIQLLPCRWYHTVM